MKHSFSKIIILQYVDSFYLEQNKTLSKEEKHFNANFLIKKKITVGKNKMKLHFFMVMEKKIKSPNCVRQTIAVTMSSVPI